MAVLIPKNCARYKVSTAAYVVSLLETQIMADLRLMENGSIYSSKSVVIYSVVDGRSLALGPDMPANQKELLSLVSRC